MTDDFFTQVLSNATLSVDTFFFTGGFLLTYTYLKSQGNKKKSFSESTIQIIKGIIRRYIRYCVIFICILNFVIIKFQWEYKFLNRFHFKTYTRISRRSHDFYIKFYLDGKSFDDSIQRANTRFMYKILVEKYTLYQQLISMERTSMNFIKYFIFILSRIWTIFKKYSFKNIRINNKFQCLSWSWYLPNDMHFFIFGSIILTLMNT